MTFPAPAPTSTGTLQSQYFKLISKLDVETARVSAALTACDRESAPDDLRGAARNGYRAAQVAIRRAIEAVEENRP